MADARTVSELLPKKTWRLCLYCVWRQRILIQGMMKIGEFCRISLTVFKTAGQGNMVWTMFFVAYSLQCAKLITIYSNNTLVGAPYVRQMHFSLFGRTANYCHVINDAVTVRPAPIKVGSSWRVSSVRDVWTGRWSKRRKDAEKDRKRRRDQSRRRERSSGVQNIADRKRQLVGMRQKTWKIDERNLQLDGVFLLLQHQQPELLQCTTTTHRVSTRNRRSNSRRRVDLAGFVHVGRAHGVSWAATRRYDY